MICQIMKKRNEQTSECVVFCFLAEYNNVIMVPTVIDIVERRMSVKMNRRRSLNIKLLV